MKLILFLLVTSFASNVVWAQTCRRSTDPNKVILMISFHDGAEEEKGARKAACARGETLVVLPDPSNQTDFQDQLDSFLTGASSRGANVSSMIVSGHDGGGEYYGDYGETSVSELSEKINQHRDVFDETSSLLLMGCWTAPPDQVNLWRVLFPNLRMIGGFVGSAPRSTRIAAGTFVEDTLVAERNLPANAGMNQINQLVRSIEHFNMLTASLYINPTACMGSSPYYALSPANSSDEIPYGMQRGLNRLPGQSEREVACQRLFGAEGLTGTYDWNTIIQYYHGDVEPENNQELRGLYSFLRNNNDCFAEGLTNAAVSADQALMLRFWGDVKKNFDKYFGNEIDAMYRDLEALLQQTNVPYLTERFRDHRRLQEETLAGLSRAQTLSEISYLTRLVDELSWNNYNSPLLNHDAPIRQTMRKLDEHLYRLQCLPGEWHDYSEDEVLPAPTC